MSPALWIGAGVLGGAGAVARVLLDGAVTRRVGARLPWGTLAVNVVGAFALGLLVRGGLDGGPLFLAGGGAIGAFTTFSTWMVETTALARGGRRRAAALNLLLGIGAGLAAAALGWWAGSLL